MGHHYMNAARGKVGLQTIVWDGYCSLDDVEGQVGVNFGHHYGRWFGFAWRNQTGPQKTCWVG
jgi:hypothetical protein